MRIFNRLLLYGLAVIQVGATDLWIIPAGSDSNDGSRENPLRSIQAALVRDPAAHVFFRPGTFSLTQPIVLDASNSGAGIEAATDHPPVFSGGRKIRAESFNTFNHPNSTDIKTVVRFDAAGEPTRNFGAVTAEGPGLVLSLGLNLLF